MPTQSQEESIPSLSLGMTSPIGLRANANQGHGCSKKENTAYLRLALFELMRRHLIGDEAPGALQRTAGR